MKNINEEHSTYVKLSYFTQGETSPTNKELVEDMILQLERLDDNVLKNPNNTFLDPCAGTGTFGVVLYNKLSQYHTHEWIMKNMIFMVDKSQVNCDILERLGFVNVYKKDFLSIEFNMKFTVVVGNPPYHAGNNKGNKLWIKFINKSLKLSDNLCYVVPMSLMTSESKQISDIRKMLNGKKNVFNLTKQDIFNVGEKVVYFTSLQSEVNHSEIILPNGDVKKVDDIFKRQSVNVNDNIKLSIFSKIESYAEKNDYSHILFTILLLKFCTLGF
jgi:16S rRNA G966 N2-methylase RsmD